MKHRFKRSFPIFLFFMLVNVGFNAQASSWNIVAFISGDRLYLGPTRKDGTRKIKAVEDQAWLMFHQLKTQAENDSSDTTYHLFFDPRSLPTPGSLPDTRENEHVRILHYSKGQLIHSTDWPEVDSTDPAVLANFIRRFKETVPLSTHHNSDREKTRNLFMYYGEQIPPSPMVQYDLSHPDSPWSFDLFMDGFKKGSGELVWDLILFQACNMDHLSVFKKLAPLARSIIADQGAVQEIQHRNGTPNRPYLTHAFLQPNQSTTEMGMKIVEINNSRRDDFYFLNWFESDLAQNLQGQISRLEGRVQMEAYNRDLKVRLANLNYWSSQGTTDLVQLALKPNLIKVSIRDYVSLLIRYTDVNNRPSRSEIQSILEHPYSNLLHVYLSPLAERSTENN